MPLYSKNRIKNAGEVLRHLDSAPREDLFKAIGVIDEWRASHAKPLRKVNAGLRHYVRKVGVDEPEVTQRLKRFATIADKLRRQSGMALSRMEDIGGVRVILPRRVRLTPLCKTFGNSPDGRSGAPANTSRDASPAQSRTAIVLFTARLRPRRTLRGIDNARSRARARPRTQALDPPRPPVSARSLLDVHPRDRA